jgi:hypothetical protein
VVPPCSGRIARVPPYSRMHLLSTCTGLSPATARLSRRFQFLQMHHWPSPRSLATTSGVSVDVLSSRYLDVSVPWVCFLSLCIQDKIPSSDNRKSETGSPGRSPKAAGLEVPVIEGGFPHSEICGSPAVRASPQLIAAYHVLHRLLPPRHPPDALRSLDRSH